MNSLRITPISALQDNYIWLIHKQNQAIAVDPGESQNLLSFLQQNRLELVQIWVTHLHADHTAAIAPLLQHYPNAIVYIPKNIAQIPANNTKIVRNQDHILVFNQYTTQIWHIPGHTSEHLGYLLTTDTQQHFFCGDTLFSAGCGRVNPPCTMQEMFNSLQKIKQLSLNTLLYPAHEYTRDNLIFAQHIAPKNPIFSQTIAHLAQPSLPTTLARELDINLFLTSQDLDSFQKLRILKNDF